MTTYYGILIQTDPHTGYGPKVGWDECYTSRSAAESSCRRATELFASAKIIEMTEEEAVANGWIGM